LQPSAPRAACRWLVVLDDLADPADLTALWPPQCASGRTVVTTRRRDAALTGPGRRRVDVGVFTPAEAEAALHQVLAERGHPAQPPGQVEALAAELGFLPLALSQAAAYITDAGLDCAAYRTLLADRARSLAGLLPRPAQGQEAGDTLVIYKPDIAALAGQVRRRRIGEWELEHPEQGRRYRDARRLVKSTFLFAGSSAAYPNCGLGLKEPGVNSLQTDQLFASAGRVGCIIPTAIATGAGGQHVFGEFARRGAVASLYDFENGNPIFPAVHASYSFACCRLPARGGASQPPVFRNRRDADLTVAIRGRIPGALAREGSGRQPVGYPAQATDPKHQERQGRQGTRR
ncbi:MAG: hypothetical protein ACRDNW_20730, partial [Trebonia sp.]